jgi:hypothetical protein
MAFKQNGTVVFGKDLGITDTTTAPSNQIVLTEGTPVSGRRFGLSVLVYRNKIYVSCGGTAKIYTYDLDGTNESVFYDAGGTVGIEMWCGNGYIYAKTTTLLTILDLNGNTVNSFSISSVPLSGCAAASGKLALGEPGAINGRGRVTLYDAVGNLIKTINGYSAVANQYFGEFVHIANGKMVVNAIAEIGDNNKYGVYYIHDLWGNKISRISRGDIGGSSLNGLSSVAAGSGRIVYRVYDAAYKLAIADLDGNDITTLPYELPTNGNFAYNAEIGNGRIVVPNGDNSSPFRIHVYDLDGNKIDTIEITEYNPINIGLYGLAVGSGKIVIGSPNSDVTTTNDGVVYIYDTPNQTHYLDLLDGL